LKLFIPKRFLNKNFIQIKITKAQKKLFKNNVIGERFIDYSNMAIKNLATQRKKNKISL